MCQDHTSPGPRPAGTHDAGGQSSEVEAFPWEAGIFDAHCHPTDIMSSIASIPAMGARTLTVMATRAQDQELVEGVAKKHGIKGPAALRQKSKPSSADPEAWESIVPAFGWHPWFSYQLYTDATYDASGDPAEQKARHYRAVLQPEPDDAFVQSLPDPTALSAYLAQTRARLEAHSLGLVGEVGLDKAFRLPAAWTDSEHSARDDGLTPGGREGRQLSPYHVRMAHQAEVLAAQLRLAGELGRAASVHGVQAHGVLFDTVAALWKGHELASKRQRKMIAKGAEAFEDEPDSDDEEDQDQDQDGGEEEGDEARSAYRPKPFPPRMCLHSYSGSAQALKQYLDPKVPSQVFVSFSAVINLSTPGGESRFPEVIKLLPDDRILVESDLHTAGEDMDGFLEEMYRKICEAKGWTLQQGVEIIGRNYERFIFG